MNALSTRGGHAVGVRLPRVHDTGTWTVTVSPPQLECFRSGEFFSELDALLDQQQPQRLVLDLDGVLLLSAAALGGLVRLRQRSERDGFSLAVSNLSTLAQEILKAARMDHLFPQHLTERSAA